MKNLSDYSSTTNSLVGAALHYASLGWRVLPLHTPLSTGLCSCNNPECALGGKSQRNVGKHPRTKNGLKEASADEATIRRWWRNWPSANIGILTGPESGIFVIDLDADIQLPAILQSLSPTIQVKTSRGKHLYLKYPTGSKVRNKSGVRRLPIDIRGAGGYAIAPPSLHQSGAIYSWSKLPGACELVEPSPELLAWLSADELGTESISRHDWITDIRILERVRKYLNACPPAISGQNGHNRTFAVVCACVWGFALDAETAFHSLQSWNSRCEPPWNEKDLRHKIEDVEKVKHDKPRGHLRDSPETGDKANAMDSLTIVEVIRNYLRSKYDPTFRRGPAIWSNALGREINRGEACIAPTSDVISALLHATDFPRSEAGPKRSALPSAYRQWAPIAWADVIASLSDESESPEVAESAAEQFRTSVANLLASLETIVHVHRDHAGKKVSNEAQRRSLIQWCQFFAKPGPWKSIRSYALWCRIQEDRGLCVAIHQRLFSQVRRGDLAPFTHRRFAQMAEMYGVGIGNRTASSRFVELTDAFIADLLTSPDDRSDDASDDEPLSGR